MLKEIRALAATGNISSGFRDETLVRGVDPNLPSDPLCPAVSIVKKLRSQPPPLAMKIGMQPCLCGCSMLTN
jgi:hypothetical protein